MLLEAPVLFLSFASVALVIFALRVMEAVRHFQPEPLRPRVLQMSRVENHSDCTIGRRGGT